MPVRADDINFLLQDSFAAFEVCAFERTAELHIVPLRSLLVKKPRTSIDPAAMRCDVAS